MLTVLRAKNFVLIGELEISLEAGLNVLTGETGAGKSIVVGAIELVLGGRASPEVVRPGAEEAEVEAHFELSARQLAAPSIAALIEAGVVTPAEAGTELCIRRVVNDKGRSRGYINGRLATAHELRAIAGELADISSQHESVALTDAATHLYYLDRFASLAEARSALGRDVEALEALVREAKELRRRDRERGERESFLRFRRSQIEEVDPKEGEVDELHAERKRLRHGARLTELTQKALARLDGEDAAIELLGRAVADLRSAADLDAALAAHAETVAASLVDVRDVAAHVARYLDESDLDPARLGQVESRLFQLETLLRQHGGTVEAVLEARRDLDAELDALDSSEERGASIRAEIERLLPLAQAQARRLSDLRRKGATELARLISLELAELGMGDARVRIDVEPLTGKEGAEPHESLGVDGARLGRDGIDRVEFMIAPNKGIEPKPLRRIASGGELSRALLALKRVLADSGPAGLYVFDEVDTGVGGRVAERIGAAIADVARHRQVLCITHLAPIAAFGDAHFVVEKASQGGRTTSLVTRIVGDARQQEVARMLSGETVSRATREAAQELIAVAARHKAGAQAPAAPPAKDDPSKIKKEKPGDRKRESRSSR